MSNVTSSKPRNILDLSIEEKRQFIDSFDYVFSDIDGVLWTLENIIKGSVEGYQVLQNAGKIVNFITNNSVRPKESYDKKFKAIGLEITFDDIWHPAKSIVNYLKRINFDGLIYIIATEAFKNVLREAGFKLIDGPTKIIEESYIDLAQNVFGRENVDAVIIDVDFNLSSVKILKAHFYLRNPKCILIAGATDMVLPVRKDFSIIGPGPFAKLLAEASKKKMITMGKPGKELGDMLMQHFDIKDSKRALMIGDMLEQDIGFGKHCNFQTIVVLSGGCTLAELEAQTNPELIPDYYAESVFDFVKLLKDLNKSNI